MPFYCRNKKSSGLSSGKASPFLRCVSSHSAIAGYCKTFSQKISRAPDPTGSSTCQRVIIINRAA